VAKFLVKENFKFGLKDAAKILKAGSIAEMDDKEASPFVKSGLLVLASKVDGEMLASMEQKVLAKAQELKALSEQVEALKGKLKPAPVEKKE
jgi:hypothetical protein